MSSPHALPPAGPSSSRLYLRVLAAIAIGGLLGHFLPSVAVVLKPLGDAFIALVKMLIAPVIFLTVVLGVAGVADLKKVGRVGAKALLYFEVMSTLALLIGFAAVKWLRPGAGFHVSVATLDGAAVSKYAQQAHEQTTTAFLLSIIPKTFIDAFTASGNLLQTLLIALLFGFSLTAIGDRAKPIVTLFESLSHAFFHMISSVMKLAPIGAGAAMAFTIGNYGIGSLLPLLKLMGAFYAACLFFIVVVLGVVARLVGFSIWQFLRYVRAELLLVLGTSSSESALVPFMQKLERLGCSRSVVGLVVPSGYSFNLDGTNIYLTMAALFVAQALDVDLSLGQQAALLGVAMLTSKGAAGVTGSGFITLAGTLAVVPSVPVAGLALILGVDRFMSEARALTNVIGNGIACIVVSRWERELDMSVLERELEGA